MNQNWWNFFGFNEIFRVVLKFCDLGFFFCVFRGFSSQLKRNFKQGSENISKYFDLVQQTILNRSFLLKIFECGFSSVSLWDRKKSLLLSLFASFKVTFKFDMNSSHFYIFVNPSCQEDFFCQFGFVYNFLYVYNKSYFNLFMTKYFSGFKIFYL